MAELRRTASAEWQGDLRSGKGVIHSKSNALRDTAYSFGTRFENSQGSNPEELIAAAHAACFSMAFSSALSKKGYTVDAIRTQATCIMVSKEGGGFRIARMELNTTGKVSGISEQEFREVAHEAEKGCPVSTLLQPGLDDISLTVRLEE